MADSAVPPQDHNNSTQQLNTNINDPGPTVRDFKYYLPLYKAALNGDWESAEKFFQGDPDAVKVTVSLPCFKSTALHVAALAGHSEFVKKLVERMPRESLALQDADGHTALHFASVAGITDAVEAMVNKNNDLTQIQDKHGITPLLACAGNVGCEENKDTIQYLCMVTRNEEPSMPFSGHSGAALICSVIASNLHDVALYLIQRYPNLATERTHTGSTALAILAGMPSAFPSGSNLGFWQRRIYSIIPVQVDKERVRRIDRITMPQNKLPIIGAYFTQGIKQVYLTKLAHIHALELLKFICTQISLMSNDKMLQYFIKYHIMYDGAKFGNVEVVTECIQTFPDQIWMSADDRSIFHTAVEHRQEKIFNLMYGMSAQKQLMASWLVEKKNNILHLAAKLAPSPQLNSTSGAALQMQRELQWYKEVDKLVQRTYHELENEDGDTPGVIFTREHKDLLEKGELWMKDTAQSCMVVAALIVTIVFAVAFTPPGGNISDSDNEKENGIPIFLHKNAFMVFIISDALALLSSTTSVLMFLSILTSRYAEEDFLYALPKRMIIGLATLFFSIATMMIAFSATLSIVLSHRLKWASIPIAAIACLPVTLFALLQSPLLVEIFLSTYGPGIFHAHSKYKL